MRWFIFPGFSALLSLSGICFLTCIVVNMYISYKKKRKYFKALVFLHSQAVAKQFSMTQPHAGFPHRITAVLGGCGCFCCWGWKVPFEGVKEFQEEKKMFSFMAIESYPVSVWVQARFHQCFFPHFVFLTHWVSVFENLGLSPFTTAVAVSYAHLNLDYRGV